MKWHYLRCRMFRLASSVCTVLIGLGTTQALAAEPSASTTLELHDPAHAVNAATWCAVHLSRREFAEALSDCNYSIMATPGNVLALSNRGSVYLMMGQGEEALKDFEAALLLAPNNPQFHYNRGLAAAKLGRRQVAIDSYTQAIRLNEKLAIAFHNRAYEYELLGERQKAIDDYQAALKIAPGLKPSLAGLKRLGASQ